VVLLIAYVHVALINYQRNEGAVNYIYTNPP